MVDTIERTAVLLRAYSSETENHNGGEIMRHPDSSGRGAGYPRQTSTVNSGAVRRAPLRHRWGVILAGGDGTRLQPLTRLACGDNRPKQFCPLLGGKTLLAHTRRRISRTVEPAHASSSGGRAHDPVQPSSRSVAACGPIVSFRLAAGKIV